MTFARVEPYVSCSKFGWVSFPFLISLSKQKGGWCPPKRETLFCSPFGVCLVLLAPSPLKPTNQVGLLVCFFLLASVFSNQPSRAYYLLWLPQAKKNPDARFVCFSLGFPTQKGARNAFLATPRRSEPKAKAASKAGLRGSAPVHWFDSTFWASGHLCFFLFFLWVGFVFFFLGGFGGTQFLSGFCLVSSVSFFRSVTSFTCAGAHSRPGQKAASQGPGPGGLTWRLG